MTKKAKPGRPDEMNNGKRMNVYLDAESIEIASKLGDGNVSKGIRMALVKARLAANKENPNG